MARLSAKPATEPRRHAGKHLREMSQQSKVPNVLRAAIRKVGLHRQADALKYVLTRLRRYPANAAYRRAHPDVAFPPPYMLYEAFNLDYRLYLEDGLDTARAFATYLRPYLTTPGSVCLDWGCGPARLTRHLPGLLPAACDVHGVDANAETIAWCRRAIPEVTFAVCDLLPPLRYANGALGGALGLSVLTHLSVAAHRAWLVEFARVIQPGGGLVLTTHGEVFRERLAAADRQR